MSYDYLRAIRSSIIIVLEFINGRQNACCKVYLKKNRKKIEKEKEGDNVI
jgi:hypothetical protein